MLKLSVHVSVLLNNCKQSITSLSLLVGTTIPFCTVGSKPIKHTTVEQCRIYVLLDFSLTVKAAPHECVMRTSQP